MENSVARSLIGNVISGGEDLVWYDLGAGSGLFTRALAESMGTGTIIAVDRDAKSMAGIPDQISDVHISKVATDFSVNLVVDVAADGILMANSLHFIKDKVLLLKTLKSILKPNGILIVVEYEMKAPTPWVPYPLDFKSLQPAAIEAGFSEVQEIATAPSKFNTEGMYSAVVR